MRMRCEPGLRTPHATDGVSGGEGPLGSDWQGGGYQASCNSSHPSYSQNTSSRESRPPPACGRLKCTVVNPFHMGRLLLFPCVHPACGPARDPWMLETSDMNVTFDRYMLWTYVHPSPSHTSCVREVDGGRCPLHLRPHLRSPDRHTRQGVLQRDLNILSVACSSNPMS